jgi:hypothetical protein
MRFKGQNSRPHQEALFWAEACAANVWCGPPLHGNRCGLCEIARMFKLGA